MGIKLKFNRLLLVSIFLLAILTLGAVSADDCTNAAEVSSEEPAEPPIAADISDDSSVEDEQITDEVALASSDKNPANDDLSAGNKKNISFEVDYNEYYINDYESHQLNPITMYWYENDATGDFSVTWANGEGGYS